MGRQVSFRRKQSWRSSAPKTVSLKPVLPLIPEVLESSEDNKSKFISLDVKTRAGGPAANNTHKKYVRIFDEGSPQQWIDLLQEVRLIWTQNSTNGPQDRVATMHSVLKGESLTAFEAALQDALIDPDPANVAPLPLTTAKVDDAIAAVGATIFPHRALELQKLWMSRYMEKPPDLSTRKTAMAITRINNFLPLFPGGTAASKFSDSEVVGLLEWSLPPNWRVKFDLDGYLPSMDTKAKLILECEAIERNEVPVSNDDKADNNKKEKKEKFGNSKTAARKGEGEKSFFCKECGRNRTHGTDKCFVLKNREKRAQQGKAGEHAYRDNKPFTKRSFRKETNAIVRKAAKHKNLKILEKSIKKAVAKEAKQAKKAAPAADSDSESDESVHVIERQTQKLSLASSSKTIAREPSKKAHPLVGIIRSCPKQKRIAAFKAQIKAKQALKAAEDNVLALENSSFLEKVNRAEQEDMMELSDTDEESD